MTSYKDDKVKRQLIMQHYTTPSNKVVQIPQWINSQLHSQNCVDNLELALKLENNVIADAKFSGEGCAIFLASCDIFIEKIKSKTIIDSKEIALNYESLINQQSANQSVLEELNIFANVKTHLNRLECAWLIKKAFDKAIA